jgi:diaminohydroxyphosphoribosylaminopyrimidine deaminase/5-amino-6-(5-phosphoribosylamino)uracil reductase
VRVVLTWYGELPADCRLLQTAREIPVLIAGPEIEEPRRQWLEGLGCEVLTTDLQELLAELGRRRMTNLLVEGGASVLGAFRDENLIDEVHVFIAPTLIGGAEALTPIAGTGAAHISFGLRLTHMTCEPSGQDWYINGQVDGQLQPRSGDRW